MDEKQLSDPLNNVSHIKGNTAVLFFFLPLSMDGQN